MPSAWLMSSIPLYTVPWWLFGVVLVLWPELVRRLYLWLLGSHRPQMHQLEVRHFRNAGVVWLVVMAIFSYAEWRWPE